MPFMLSSMLTKIVMYFKYLAQTPGQEPNEMGLVIGILFYGYFGSVVASFC